ncbi:unnamed protein product [Paramecium sonneborni]|uniref:DH domain-containing protein n=1 Tax=Paramecium sonneborni TaxID=65129 RepID=A0A8S1RHN6_9CILI|nr:unnamed protein product [Paramecium sonneborni]
MFVSQSKVLEQCLLDITKQVLGEQIDRENRGAVLNRIKEITLETFQKHYSEEILLLQQELRQQNQINDRIKREYQDREQQLMIDLEHKLHEQQITQVQEIKSLQQLCDEQTDLNNKQQQSIEKLNKQIKESHLTNQQLTLELQQLKDTHQTIDMQSRYISQEGQEYKSKAEQYQSAYTLLEQQFKTYKQESDKQLKDYQRRLQTVTDQNIFQETELSNLKVENEQLKIKKQQESQKQKEALEQLKEKSQNKIKEYKLKVKDLQNKDQYIIELQEQVKELEQQIEFHTTQHRQAIKMLEQQYKKQYTRLEEGLEQEKSDLQQHLTTSFQSTISEKDKDIIGLTQDIKQLKIQLQNEQEQKLKNNSKYEEIIQTLKKQLEEQQNQIDESLQKNKILEQENNRKDQNLKLLLADVDDLKQFSEQTLNTLKENQDYMSEIEREKQQQQEIILSIQHQLEIEIQGSFSYQRLGQELEQRCKLYKEEHCQILEEQLKKEAQYQQDIQFKENKFKQEIDNLNKEHQLMVENFENQLKKMKLESKLQNEEQIRAYNQIQKELFQKVQQYENLEKQNNNLINELEQYISQYTHNLQQLEEQKIKEKNLIESLNKNQNLWNTEKHQLVLQIDELQFKYRSMKQKIQRLFIKQKEQFNLQLIETKSVILNKVKNYDSENRQLLQSTVKKFNYLIDQRVQQEKRENEFSVIELQKEMERKIEQLKRQYKQNEQLIQEEAQIKFKQKLSQIQQHDQSIDDLKNQLNYYIHENEHLSQKVQVLDQLNREQQKKAEYEQRQLHQTIKELEDELNQIQQSADYTMKERQFLEQRYNELKDKSEKKMDQIQRDYQQQIQQLETIIQPVQQRALSPPLHQHTQSSSTGFHRSPVVQQNLSSAKHPYAKPPQYSSPSIRTPHKSPSNDRTDKTIEELRAEIQQQKEKLSRMKLNFTESQKKSKTLSKF